MREIVRPSLHFTPQKGWINDPNGLVFLKDNIIYFISIIRTMITGTVCTGACGKQDLIHWEELEPALVPDMPYDNDKNGGCFRIGCCT